jgi:hypothetical protein
VFQLKRASDTVKEQDVTISETKQQVIILEDQLDHAREEGAILGSGLGALYHKYSQALTDIAHLEASVKTLQVHTSYKYKQSSGSNNWCTSYSATF